MATYKKVAGSEMERPASEETSYTVNYAKRPGFGVSVSARKVMPSLPDFPVEDVSSRYRGEYEVVVLSVEMHCKCGCARLVSDSVKSFKGVKPVEMEPATVMVTVKGENVDPDKLVHFLHEKTEKKIKVVTRYKESNDKNKSTDTSESSEKKQGNPDDKKNKQIVVSPQSIDDDHNKNNKVEKHKDKEQIGVSPQSIDDHHNKNNKDEKHKEKESIEQPPERTATITPGCPCDGCIKKTMKAISETKGIREKKVDDEKKIVTVTGTMDVGALEKALKEKLKPKSVKVEILGESSKSA